MNISITKAKAQLTELVRRAEAGEEVILTRHGQPAARIGSARTRPAAPRTPSQQLALLKAVQALQEAAAQNMTPGPDAAHASDFLFDDDGMPA